MSPSRSLSLGLLVREDELKRLFVKIDFIGPLRPEVSSTDLKDIIGKKNIIFLTIVSVCVHVHHPPKYKVVKSQRSLMVEEMRLPFAHPIFYDIKNRDIR